MIQLLQNVVTHLGVQGIIAIGLGLVGFVASLCWLYFENREDDTLERHLGVRPTYTWQGLPDAKIGVYEDAKEGLRTKFAPHAEEGDDDWMQNLPPQEKDLLKYYLMQRAIGDMAALRKIDADARGYWKLFSKGIVTERFWNSVVEVEHEVSAELEDVKTEAASLEPNQDPQGIISEAMQWLFRFGDKLPPDPPAGTNPLEALLSNPAAMAAGLQNGGLPGMPPGPMPPNLGGMGGPAPSREGSSDRQGPEIFGSENEADGYKWSQDNEEVEVNVVVSPETKKSDVKVVFKVTSLRVEHSGEVLCEGKLAARCEPENSTWTLSKGRIVCSLAKAEPRAWRSLFIK